jgi:hypothetical protein
LLELSINNEEITVISNGKQRIGSLEEDHESIQIKICAIIGHLFRCLLETAA